MAKWRLNFAGLKVGSVITLPFLFVRPEVFSLIKEEPIDPRIAQPEMTLMVTVGGHEHGGHGHDASHEATTIFITTAPSKISGIALLSSLFSGPLVIGQSPAVGTAVAHGSSVNLTVLGN